MSKDDDYSSLEGMRGVILAGGLGTRLNPLTHVTNKHLLPVYDKPMIFYPIQTLVSAGIKELMIIVSGPHSGSFLPILKNGDQFGLKHIEYAYQEKADGGIADALALAEDFSDGGNIAVMLGDNTMDIDSEKLKSDFEWFSGGAHVFLKEVDNPNQFGVAKVNARGRITEIVEKPTTFISNSAVIGLYLYDDSVFDIVKQCKVSARGQLEITDVNNVYINKKQMKHSVIEGFWQDAGTHENLYLANKYWYEKSLCK
jgi:glucose-1-phosphate thymidylyltransferase